MPVCVCCASSSESYITEQLQNLKFIKLILDPVTHDTCIFCNNTETLEKILFYCENSRRAIGIVNYAMPIKIIVLRELLENILLSKLSF